MFNGPDLSNDEKNRSSIPKDEKDLPSFPGLEPYKGPWGSGQILHLLKRTMFGSKKSDLDHFKKRTLQQTINELLNPVPQNASLPINDYDSISINIPYGTTWVDKPFVAEESAMRIDSFLRWSMGSFINQDTSIREKMHLFWHNHFANQNNVGYCDIVWKHYSLLRNDALGNFRELTRKIALDGHMLRFLNGAENTRLAPNENFARELQELFCIGKGPNAKFTEEDVKQAAKVLTGWKVDLIKGIVSFKEEDHDTTDKHFSSFYNNTIIYGRTGPDAGKEELNALLDMIFKNEETALFICRKLFRWFVYYKIDEQVELKVITPMAAILRKNDYNIQPVLEALLKSNHFYSAAVQGVQIKSPIDFCIGMQREFNVTYLSSDQFALNYSMWTLLIEYCSLMGQTYADPPSVSGWPAYYQVPDFNESWINTGLYPIRNEFSATMIDFGFNRLGHFFNADVIAFARSLSNPGDPDSLIAESLELLYRIDISAASKAELKKNTLLSGQLQDHYWTDAWNDYIADTENEVLKSVVENRLKNLYRFIVNSPEYQLV